MVLAVGSMMVKGVFKAGGLLTGLGSMVGKLKGAQQEGKSTSTEMKRMTGHAHLLRNALAMIGVGGFSALLMQTPALAGGLAKIKNEMMLIAYAVGRHLKPSLDAVATILQGIRTGDWTKIKQGVLDLGEALLGIGGVVIDVVFGEGAASKAKEDFTNWIDNLKTAWEEGDLVGLIKGLLWDPAAWVVGNAYEWGKKHLGPHVRAVGQAIYDEGTRFMDDLKSERSFGEALRNVWGIGKLMQFGGFDRALQQKNEKIEAQGGPSGKSGFMWDQNISMMDAWKRNIKDEWNIGKQDVSIKQGGIPDFEPRQSFDDYEKLKGGIPDFEPRQDFNDYEKLKGGIPDFMPRQDFNEYEKLKGGIWDHESTTIDTQTNTFNIDVSGVVGDFEDPIIQNKIYDIVTRALRDNQQKVTY